MTTIYNDSKVSCRFGPKSLRGGESVSFTSVTNTRCNRKGLACGNPK